MGVPQLQLDNNNINHHQADAAIAQADAHDAFLYKRVAAQHKKMVADNANDDNDDDHQNGGPGGEGTICNRSTSTVGRNRSPKQDDDHQNQNKHRFLQKQPQQQQQQKQQQPQRWRQYSSLSSTTINSDHHNNNHVAKTVTFRTTTTMREILPLSELSDQDISDVWYSDDDYAAIKQHVSATIQRVTNGESMDEMDGWCLRGLEGRTKFGARRRKNNKAKAMDAVWTTQVALWKKHVENPSIIAAAYKPHSTNAKYPAIAMAHKDELCSRNHNDGLRERWTTTRNENS